MKTNYSRVEHCFLTSQVSSTGNPQCIFLKNIYLFMFSYVSFVKYNRQGKLGQCMYVKYSARRQIRSSTCTTRVVHISVYQTKERSEVVCQVLCSLSQWPYGNTFHCTHRHKSAANTTTQHPHTPNSSQTGTAINGTDPSWELQIFLQPKPVDKCFTTASIIHSHRQYSDIISIKNLLEKLPMFKFIHDQVN